jgi:hypothetical protein
MTIGWGEALIIFILLVFLLALAFRGGYVRGRMRRSSVSRKRTRTSLTDDVRTGPLQWGGCASGAAQATALSKAMPTPGDVSGAMNCSSSQIR